MDFVDWTGSLGAGLGNYDGDDTDWFVFNAVDDLGPGDTIAFI